MLIIGVMPMPPAISTAGTLGIGVDEEVAGGRLHPQHVADLDAIVEVVGRHARRQLGLIGRRGTRLIVTR